MLGWMLAAVAVASPLDIAQEPVQPDQWLCTRDAIGPRHAKVTVQVYVEADGMVVGRGVFWYPPRDHGQTDAPRFNGAAPELSVQYNEPTDDGLGKPSDVGASLSLKPGRRLPRRAAISMTLDTGGTWTAPLVVWKFADQPPSLYTADLSDADPAGEGVRDVILEDAFDGARTADLALLDGKRRLVSMRYDLSDHSLRDSLFLKAWSEAHTAGKHLESCNKTTSPPASATKP